MGRKVVENRVDQSMESQLRSKVEQLTYLPASAAVAVKFIEIGKDPDAGPREYEKIISSDTSLSTKVLALANSSWFGVRNKVSKVMQAVNLLGLANVRTLAVSYCMAGIYTHLKIKKEDVSKYWQASMCKGVAAKTFALSTDEKVADEAFLAGLFQDMAIPLIHSVAKDPLLKILQDPDCDSVTMLAEERRAFGVDHTEVGRWLGAKLELPESYKDAIAFHHDSECLGKFIESDALGWGIRAASLFPHYPDHWHAGDIEALADFLTQHAPGEIKDVRVFMERVQEEFDTLFGFFENGTSPELRLLELMPEVASEVADSATHIIGQMQGMMRDAAETGTMVQGLADENNELADRARLDPLTCVLNHREFLASGADALQNASRYATPSAVMFFDVNAFKSINDTHGHAFGDYILTELCARIRPKVRKGDWFGRVGGDEFALFLCDLSEDSARDLVETIVRVVDEEPFAKGKTAVRVQISVGVLLVPSCREQCELHDLMEQADQLMYRSKRAGAGHPCFGTFEAVSRKS